MATTKKTTTNDSGEGIRVSDADSELLASLQSAAKSVAAVVAQGKTVVKALERFDAPKSLDRQDYLADALDALRGVDLNAYGCGALQGVIAESIEQRLRTLRATAHHELLTGLRDGVEKELPLPRRFEPTRRGKRFALPKSRGGRHGRKDIITSEDMLKEARRKFRWSGGARKAPDPGDGHTFFEPRRMARAEPQYGPSKVNPNMPNHLLGKKKKRNRPN